MVEQWAIQNSGQLNVETTGSFKVANAWGSANTCDASGLGPEGSQCEG